MASNSTSENVGRRWVRVKDRHARKGESIVSAVVWAVGVVEVEVAEGEVEAVGACWGTAGDGWVDRVVEMLLSPEFHRD